MPFRGGRCACSLGVAIFQPSDDRDAAFDFFTFGDQDFGARRQYQVCPRAEPDEAYPLPSLDGITGPLPENDAPRNQARYLLEDHRCLCRITNCARIDRYYVLFVLY